MSPDLEVRGLVTSLAVAIPSVLTCHLIIDLHVCLQMHVLVYVFKLHVFFLLKKSYYSKHGMAPYPWFRSSFLKLLQGDLDICWK